MFTLPAGTYYIGDPCYVIENHDQWMRFLDSSNFFIDNVKATDGELEIYAAKTMYGDGVYEDEIGNTYPVDSGLLGIVSMEVVLQTIHHYDTEDLLIKELNAFGLVINIKTPINCAFENGVFDMYTTDDEPEHIRIDTDYFEEDYDYVFDEEEHDYVLDEDEEE